MCAVPVSSRQQASQATLVHFIDRSVDLLGLHRRNPRRYPHLLQSTAHGRYDILFACPGDSLLLDADGAFDDWWHREANVESSESGLPFSGGWFVYLGYELAGQIEPTLQLPDSDSVLPVALATRFKAAIIRDNDQQQLFAVAEAGQSSTLAVINDDIAALAASDRTRPQAPVVARVREDDSQAYIDAIARIHRYIHEGDVFQVNLSRRWEITLAETVSAASRFRVAM